MNDNYAKNRFYRMQTEIWLLTAFAWNEDEIRFSIKELAKNLGVTQATVRDDLDKILGIRNDTDAKDEVSKVRNDSDKIQGTKSKKKIKPEGAYGFDYCDNKEKDFEGDDFEEEPKKEILPQIVEADKDIYLTDSNGYNSRTNGIVLVLDLDEWTVLNDFTKNGYDSGIKKSCWIKNSFVDYSEEDIKNMDILDGCISRNDFALFEYKSKEGKSEKMCILPRKLVHEANSDFIYVYGENEEGNKRYRFDRILGEVTSKKNDKKNIGSDRKTDRPVASSSEKKTHVKIKIFKDEAKVVEKIHLDLGRKVDKHFTEYEDYVIYEDDVTNPEQLESLIYSYGFSVVVLEPLDMRNRIIESIKKRLEYYES